MSEQQRRILVVGAGLMRSATCDIVAAGGTEIVSALLDECAAIATAQGFPPRADHLDRTRRTFTSPGSPLTSSMLLDIERGAPIEADQILGDLLRRASPPSALSPLRFAYTHAKAYQARRVREQTSAS